MKYILKYKKYTFFNLLYTTYTAEYDNIYLAFDKIKSLLNETEVTVSIESSSIGKKIYRGISNNWAYIVLGFAIAIGLVYFVVSYVYTGTADYKPLQDIIIESP